MEVPSAVAGAGNTNSLVVLYRAIFVIDTVSNASIQLYECYMLHLKKKKTNKQKTYYIIIIIIQISCLSGVRLPFFFFFFDRLCYLFVCLFVFV